MRPSIARISEQVDPQFAARERSIAPVSHTIPFHVAATHLPIRWGERLSLSEHAVV